MIPEQDEIRVLVVDDEADVRRSIRRILEPRWTVVTAGDGQEALDHLGTASRVPDVVLLDIRMPGMDGHAVCERMQARDDWAWIPVIFVTALGSKKDFQRALRVGAADYLQKPINPADLIDTVETHLQTSRRWKRLREEAEGRSTDPESTHPVRGAVEADVASDGPVPGDPKSEDDDLDWRHPATFQRFKDYLVEARGPDEEVRRAMSDVGPDALYDLAGILDLPTEHFARHLARFLGVPFAERIQPSDADLSALPRPFCRSNRTIPMMDGSVILANPFDWELVDSLERTFWFKHAAEPAILIGDPDRVAGLLEGGKNLEMMQDQAEGSRVISLESGGKLEEKSGMQTANEILRGAIDERASDIHIEPGEEGARVRYRIDGDMYDIRTIGRDVAQRVISRMKALAGMNIAEKRKPQDGSVRAQLKDRDFKLRLATSATTVGETLVIRLLEPEADPVPFEELGMTPEQADQLRVAAERHQGMILLVGPTGSGKSTTIFTLLSKVDGVSRSIMSVEDPVEYNIRHANQQQVNEVAGVTFRALLKSAMRQDPDILFLGEIRDTFSAHAALDFASSGHLTVSTLHASNSTSAIFRLERLEVDRAAMADALSVVVAQRLLKTLCAECREVGAPTGEEVRILERFTDDIPDRVARPVGCPACRETGYSGREGVHEILVFDEEITDRIRKGAAVAELRDFCVERGDFLMADHAIQKIHALRFSVEDINEAILVEEKRSVGGRRGESVEDAGETGESVVAMDPTPASEEASTGASELVREADEEPLVLVVDDDPDLRALVELYLKGAGYGTVAAEDGVDALMMLGDRRIDAVLSDLHMPNLDGERLMEIMVQKGLDVPVLFLTGTENTDVEARMLQLGATDFLSKPVKKDVLLLRLERALERAGASE